MAGNDDRQGISSHRLSDGSGCSRASDRGCELDIGPSFSMGNGSGGVPALELKIGASRSRDILEMGSFSMKCRQQSIGKVREQFVIPDSEFPRIRMLTGAVPGHLQPTGPDHAFRFLEKVEGGLGLIKDPEPIHGYLGSVCHKG